MNNNAVLTVLGLGAIALVACSSATLAGEPRVGVRTYAVGYRHGEPQYYRRRHLYARRHRGYRRSDAINTYGHHPPPWAEVRQTPSGPFDSGFFFDSGVGPHGGNSPYLH
jgi:hypothetical protein